MLNEILGPAARLNQLLTRKFNITGGAPSPQLTPEITPGYTYQVGAEDLVLAGEMIATGTIDLPAVAAQRSVAQLRNQTTGLVIVVEQIRCRALAAIQDLSIGMGFTTTNHPVLPAVGGVTFADLRHQQLGNVTVEPAGRLTGTALTPPVLFQPNLLLTRSDNTVNGEVIYDEPIVLPPNGAVQVYTAVNIEVIASFRWREVPVSPGEVGPF